MSIYEIPQMTLEEVHSRIARWMATNHVRPMVQILPAHPKYSQHRFDDDGYLIDWGVTTDQMILVYFDEDEEYDEAN